MRNVAFIIWMIGWPLSCEISKYLTYLSKGSVVQEHSDQVKFIALVLMILIWVGVATILYEPRS